MANRLVIGSLPGGGFGMRCSMPGKNVLSASLSEQDMSFDSSWETLRIGEFGKVAYSGYSGKTTATLLTVFHSMGVVPHYVARLTRASTYVYGQLYSMSLNSSSRFYQNLLYTEIDASRLDITLHPTLPSQFYPMPLEARTDLFATELNSGHVAYALFHPTVT